MAPQSSYQAQQPPSTIPPNPTQYPPRPTTAGNYRDPPPIEVYTLPDQANLSIPAEVREQYQRDEFGRVLFFTTPPVSVAANTVSGTTVRGHSVRYLAAKARREEELAQRRKQHALEKQHEARAAKKAKLEQDKQTELDIEAMKIRALSVMEKQLAEAVDGELRDQDIANLSASQKAHVEQMRAVEANRARRTASRMVKLGEEVFADDWDNRIS
jgi:chromatin structure-remodeling complex subunit RSC1/2